MSQPTKSQPPAGDRGVITLDLAPIASQRSNPSRPPEAQGAVARPQTNQDVLDPTGPAPWSVPVAAAAATELVDVPADDEDSDVVDYESLDYLPRAE